MFNGFGFCEKNIYVNDIRQLKAQELKREPDFVHDEDPDSAKLHETIKNKKGDRERVNREKERVCV